MTKTNLKTVTRSMLVMTGMFTIIVGTWTLNVINYIS